MPGMGPQGQPQLGAGAGAYNMPHGLAGYTGYGMPNPYPGYNPAQQNMYAMYTGGYGYNNPAGLYGQVRGRGGDGWEGCGHVGWWAVCVCVARAWAGCRGAWCFGELMQWQGWRGMALWAWAQVWGSRRMVWAGAGGVTSVRCSQLSLGWLCQHARDAPPTPFMAQPARHAGTP